MMTIDEMRMLHMTLGRALETVGYPAPAPFPSQTTAAALYDAIARSAERLASAAKQQAAHIRSTPHVD